MKISKYLGIIGLGALLGSAGTAAYHDYPMYKEGMKLKTEADQYRSHWYNYLNFQKGLRLMKEGEELKKRIRDDSFFLKYFLKD